jgi:SPP1 family predicted phage head-tail adaptor
MGTIPTLWTDFYTCWATPVQGGGSEKQEAGTTNSTDAIDFTVRYAKCLEGLDSTKIRIRLGDVIYNVTAIDPMGFHHPV